MEKEPKKPKDVWDFDPGDFLKKLLNLIRARLDLKNRTTKVVNKIGPRRFIVALAAVWTVAVVCAGWGDYSKDLVEKEFLGRSLHEADYHFAEGMFGLGFLASSVALVGILIVQFTILKSKLVTWIIGAIPIAAFLIDVIATNHGEDWKLVASIATAVITPFCLLFLPLIIAFAFAANAFKTVIGSIFGPRR